MKYDIAIRVLLGTKALICEFKIEESRMEIILYNSFMYEASWELDLKLLQDRVS